MTVLVKECVMRKQSQKCTGSKLYRLEDMVREILEQNERARDDDRELTLRVHMDYYGINPYAPYCEVMWNDKIPSQESIGRCRRKIQETDFKLRGSKAKEEIRMDEQEVYIDYALNSERRDQWL